jgi:hypothetical protein
MWNHNGSSQMRGALSEDDTNDSVYRVFNRTEKQFKSTEKKLSKHLHDVHDIYRFSHTDKNGALIWKHFPVACGQGTSDIC